MEHKDSGVFVTLEELLELSFKAKGFSFLPSRRVGSILNGRHNSKMRGRGMDFSEMKQFVQGDNVRNIDWKATRRTGKPYVRLFNEERDRAVWLVVSQRNSMFFGTTKRMKSVVASYLTALTAFRVVDSGDRVGAVLYNDTTIKVCKAQRGKESIYRLLYELVDLNNQLGKNSNNNNGQLNRALETVGAMAKHDDLIILIGDGRAIDDKSVEYITTLSTHNDIISALIYDPMEMELPNQKSLFLSDGSKSVDIDGGDKNFRDSFKKRLEGRKNALKNLSIRHTIPLLTISTNDDVLEQIQKQLGVDNGC